jgi:hypothetical protein
MTRKNFTVRFMTTCGKSRKVKVQAETKEKAQVEALELFRHLQPDLRRYDAIASNQLTY